MPAKDPGASLARKAIRAAAARSGAAAPKTKAAKKTAERFDASAHPLRGEIDAVRQIILGASPAISEGVKWNAPSFRTQKEWFATLNLRSKQSVQVILHLGAKARPNLKPFEIADPKALMKWLGKDRALVTLGAGRDIAANRKALEAIVRAWIKHV